MSESKKPAPDWELIERDYRTGVLSLREIAGQNGISDTAIRKRAKAQGWERDIGAKVQAKADALVRKEEVRKQVRTEMRTTERELVEATAQVIADVRMRHRGDITKATRLTMKLFDELELQTDSVELLQQLGDLLRAEDEKGHDKLNDLYQKVIAMPSRVDSLKKLTESLKNVIGLEREAYSIKAEPAEVNLNHSGSTVEVTKDAVTQALKDMENDY